MNTRLSPLKASQQNQPRLLQPIRAQWGRRGLEIYGLKKGDKVSIEPFGKGKVLYVNGEQVKWLEPIRTEDRIAICNDNLKPGDIEIQGEEGIETTVEYWDAKGQILNGSEEKLYETDSDKNFIQDIIDAPAKAYPEIGRDYLGIRIKGSF